MTFRTDLALEAAERVFSRPEGSFRGITQEVRSRRGFTVTEIRVENEEGAALLEKPLGRYVTIAVDKLLRREDESFSACCVALSEELMPFLPEDRRAPVLVVCLGNPSVTPDGVGRSVASRLLVTRHLAHELDWLRPVALLEPGVLGTTGIESASLVKSAVGHVRPACVVAVDALAARSADRLLRTVQVSNAGIVPGSGIDAGRQALSRSELGVPVLALGVPTVVDAATLVSDYSGNTITISDPLIVTPCDIDAKMDVICKAISYGLNLALHPGLTIADLDQLL